MTLSLVLGASGFAGSHLCEHLLTRDRRVVGTATTLRPGLVPEGIEWHACDVRDRPTVQELVRRLQPDEVYHLAAPPFVPDSFVDPTETYRTIVLGTSHVLEAVRAFSPHSVVLVVTTGEVYGQGDPLKPSRYVETAPFRPRSPYAAAKAAADLVAQAAHTAFGLKVLRARPFNHFGPRQSPRFVCASFARQLATIHAGHAPPALRVGNLETRRDFLDVGDVVRGYVAIVERGEAGEAYNVCSGKSVTIREVLDTLVRLTGVEIDIQVDPTRLRPVDVAEFSGDGTKLRETTGWKPETPLERGLGDLIAYWGASRKP
jgi:GDP-4-dehydro-6-deoxy-D-mannose reductase